MSKEEIKKLLMEFFIDYDTHRWSNDDIYDKYAELLYKPISDLEAKLAEKEEEIKKLNLEAQKYFEDAYCNDAIYQDKISFAVEQLEKAKEWIDTDFRKQCNGILVDLYNVIDNQIKEIKEME